jgi:hypothetical protein
MMQLTKLVGLELRNYELVSERLPPSGRGPAAGERPIINSHYARGLNVESQTTA